MSEPVLLTSVVADARAADTWLPGWDYLDGYERPVHGTTPDALTAARCLLAPTAAGRRLLRLRDLAVRVVGLRPAVEEPTEGGLLFPVLHATEQLAVLGLDDRHLDFRVVLQVAGGRVRCTTVVRRHNALGRAYFTVVGPFHRRLVPRLLDRASRRGWRPRG